VVFVFGGKRIQLMSRSPETKTYEKGNAQNKKSYRCHSDDKNVPHEQDPTQDIY
jgi:hypothetical protein